MKDRGYLTKDVLAQHGVESATIEDNLDTSTANGRLVMNALATVSHASL